MLPFHEMHQSSLQVFFLKVADKNSLLKFVVFWGLFFEVKYFLIELYRQYVRVLLIRLVYSCRTQFHYKFHLMGVCPSGQ